MKQLLIALLLSLPAVASARPHTNSVPVVYVERAEVETDSYYNWRKGVDNFLPDGWRDEYRKRDWEIMNGYR